jgi:hypothetical protein
MQQLLGEFLELSVHVSRPGVTLGKKRKDEQQDWKPEVLNDPDQKALHSELSLAITRSTSILKKAICSPFSSSTGTSSE